MLHTRRLGLIGLCGLLASTAVSTAANADQRAYYAGSGGGNYWSDPQVRLGIDVLWGGHGYAPPAHRSPGIRHRHPGGLAPCVLRADYYNEGHSRGHHKHRKHPHHNERWDDCDD